MVGSFGFDGAAMPMLDCLKKIEFVKALFSYGEYYAHYSPIDFRRDR